MKRDLPDPEQFEADFALSGALEYDELEDDDTALEMELLLTRVQAARSCGA